VLVIGTGDQRVGLPSGVIEQLTEGVFYTELKRYKYNISYYIPQSI
jgi:hypothetical protein